LELWSRAKKDFMAAKIAFCSDSEI
jgi:hypothetical protein